MIRFANAVLTADVVHFHLNGHVNKENKNRFWDTEIPKVRLYILYISP